jgi:hypothetical protein
MSKQRILEIAADEVWSPFFESINDLMLQEKKYRFENDANKLAEVCKQIVSVLHIKSHSSLS